MSRWFRWQWLAPRLLLGVVAVLGLQYGLGQAARSIAVRSGEVVVGAPVHVGHARVSFRDRRIVLSDLSIANPRRPNQRWLEADHCELEIAAAPLLHKQTIIDRGRINGVRFGTVGQAGDTRDDGTSTAPSATINWFRDNADKDASAWLTSIDKRFEHGFIDQFESVKRTEAFCARWPPETAALSERALALKGRADHLEQATAAAQANRLRHDEFLNDVPAEIAALRQEFHELSAEFDELPQHLEHERRAIVAARRQDEQLLRERLRLEAIDDKLLTAYLIREQLARPLDELLAWLRWARQVVPLESTGRRARQRGEDVLFTGIRPSARFLLRALEVQGTASIMDRPVELRGMLSGITTTPSLYGEPMRLRLTSAGSIPLELRVSIDRTGAVARDELLVDCHGIPLPELSLGRMDQLQLRLAPSVGSLSVSISVEGEKLSGDIQLVQKQVRITSVLGGDLSNLPLVAPLDATLGEVSSLATRLSVQGTIDEPSCTLWSNLGSALAEALERALRRSGDEHARAVLAEARRHVDERLAGLERQVADQQMKFASQMTAMPQQLDNIERQQARRERISVEQLGRRLPSNSLFR